MGGERGEVSAGGDPEELGIDYFTWICVCTCVDVDVEEEGR